MRLTSFPFFQCFAAILLSAVCQAAPPTVRSEGTWQATRGAFFHYQIVPAIGPTSYSASPLPAGLTLDTHTGMITGTPTAAGSTLITLGASNADGTGTASLALTVQGDMEKGADVSYLQQMSVPPGPGSAPSIRQPFQFYDTSGLTLDPDPVTNCLMILKERGINMVRLRVFVPPIISPNWDEQLSGSCTIEEMVPVAQKAHALGLRVYMDLHCSWTFADPDNQRIPVEWANEISGMSHDQAVATLSKDIATHVTDVLTKLQAAGVTPEFLSIGNEIGNGILTQVENVNGPHTNPANIEGGGDDLAAFINAGYYAVKNIDPNVKLVIQATADHNDPSARGYFDSLQAHHGHWDITGPDSGGPIGDIAYTMSDMASRYTLPGQGGDGSMLSEFESPNFDTITAYLNLMRAVPNGRGHGVVLWEAQDDPDWRGYGLSAFANHEPTSALDAFRVSTLNANGLTISGYNEQAVSLKGVNLAGWMVMEPGLSPTDSSGLPDEYSILQVLDARFGVPVEQSMVQNYRGNWINKQDLDNVKAQGLNVVRVPVWWGDFYPLSVFDTKTVAINSPPTAVGTVGMAFSYLISATNIPTTFTATDSPLPPGLTLNPSTGLISGTPTVAGKTTVTLKALKPGEMGTEILTISVNAPVAGSPMITSTTGLSVSSSNPLVKYVIAGTNTPNTFSTSSLPSGLSFNNNTISGTLATNAAGVDIVITAGNAAGSNSTTLSLTVTGPPNPVPVPRQDAFNLLDSLILSGAERGISTIIDLHGAFGGQSNSARTGYAQQNQYWSSNADQANTALLWAAIAAHYRGNTWVAGYDLLDEPTGAPSNQAVATQLGNLYSTVRAVDPTHMIFMQGTGGWGALPDPATQGWMNVAYEMHDKSTAGEGIQDAASQVTDFTNHQSYHVPAYIGELNPGVDDSATWRDVVNNFNTNNMSWSAWPYKAFNGKGPTPSSLFSPSGKVTAVPNVTSDSSSTINSDWSKWSTSSAFVADANISNVLTGTAKITSLSQATVTSGTPFVYMITATGGATGFNATNLPTGLSLDPSTGIISGTIPIFYANSPDQYFNIPLSATTLAGPCTGNLRLLVHPYTPIPVITSPGSSSATLGKLYSYQITATCAPTYFSGNATGQNTLPPGFFINGGSGVLSGTPTSLGPLSVYISANNAWGTGGRTIVITVNAPAPVITSGSTAQGVPGTPFVYQILANNSPTSYGATGLPTGLSLDTATGKISGTTTQTGIFTIGLIARNAGGAGTTNVLLTIQAPGSTAALPFPNSAATAVAQSGSPFSYTITASGAPTSYGATGLPKGLTVNASTGIISGSTTATGTYVVLLSATNTSGTGTANLTLTVNPPPPVIQSSTTAVGAVGLAFYYPIGATNTPTSYTATGLPAGVGLNSTTGVISGIPKSSGVFNVSLTATNAGGTANSSLSITITIALPNITSSSQASGKLGVPFSYQIVASNSPTIYGANGLPAGLAINTLTGAILGTVTVPGTYGVTLSATNVSGTGTANLSLVFQQAAPVITSGTTATGNPGLEFNYVVVATNSPTSYSAKGLPAGLSINSQGLISGTATAKGTFSITLGASNAGGTGTANLLLTFAPNVPTINATSPATGGSGLPFSYTILANNSPTSYGATGLPAGLVLDTATGLISGSTTLSGTFSVGLSATNTQGTGTATLSLTINSSAPVITSAATASCASGASFAYGITATNSPTSFQASGLPPGLTINTVTGVISGTPTNAGNATIQLGATNAGGIGSGALRLTVSASPPVITSALTAAAQVGTPFTYVITATNSPTGFGATGLPGGLSISTPTGGISGTPTKSGKYTVSLSATNPSGVGTANLVLSVSAGPVTIPFNSWISSHNPNGLDSSPTASPLNDGVPNLLKYLLDIDPSKPMTASDRAIFPTPGIDSTTVPGTEYLTLTYRQNAILTGLTVDVQTSTDLQTWSSVIAPKLLVQQLDQYANGDTLVEVEVPMPTTPSGGTPAKMFIRLSLRVAN